MKAQIEYISASAGSGKTHALIETITHALLTDRCSPSELIATTFTRKAAEELKQKLTQRLLVENRSDLASQLDHALIGTVHGICLDLIERFSFEAGLSPATRVLEMGESNNLLDQVTERVVDPVDISRIQTLSDRLNQSAYQRPFLWQGQLRAIIEVARSNAISPTAFSEMAQRSTDSYLAQYPAPQPQLESYIRQVIGVATKTIPAKGDTTRVTENYLKQVDRFVERLDRGELTWLDWLKLTNAKPGARSEPSARCVQLIAEQFVSHPDFHRDIREYIFGLFDLAAKVLAEFQMEKKRRGVLDFNDLEDLALQLLKNNKDVREECAGHYRLLMVDEYQDTSPLQLALFVELAELAGHATWVGDSKQSIYGFRGCDAGMIDATVDQLRQTQSPIRQLSDSWRSIPDLVNLVNQVFAEPFRAIRGNENINLRAKREALRHEQAALELVKVSNGRTRWDGSPLIPSKVEYSDAVAAHVKALLENKDFMVFDCNNERPVQVGDIAVLCQSNGYVQNIATALLKLGVPVRQSQPGLMVTPEIRLAMACLRVALDPEDTLARAEVLFLTDRRSRGEIISDRIEFVQSEANQERDSWAEETATLKELMTLRTRVALMSVTELVDEVLRVTDTWQTITAWGPTSKRAAQRRANLDALRALAERYAANSSNARRSQSPCGFVQWCRDLADDGADFLASGENDEGIQVLTYHAAKGLEWPVVVCTQLDTELRDRWAEPAAEVNPQTSFNLEDPLQSREIRFWPTPFGDRGSSSTPYARLMQQPDMDALQAQTREEALRLLYVGFTRARDLLVLVEREGAPMRWLDQAGVKLPATENGELVFADDTTVSCRTITASPICTGSAEGSPQPLQWFSPTVDVTCKPPARIAPSQEIPIGGSNVGEVIEYAQPLKTAGTFDPTILGNAFHSLIAVDLLNPSAPDNHAMAQRIVANHQLDGVIDPDQLIDNLTHFHKLMSVRFRPESIRVETPFSFSNGNGQITSGFIDLCLETPSGLVIIDHKVLACPRANLPAKALKFSGQLHCYREAVERTERIVRGTWIHYPLSGAILRVDLNASEEKLQPSRSH